MCRARISRWSNKIAFRSSTTEQAEGINIYWISFLGARYARERGNCSLPSVGEITAGYIFREAREDALDLARDARDAMRQMRFRAISIESIGYVLASHPSPGRKRTRKQRRRGDAFSRISHRRRRNCDLQLAKRAIVKSCRDVIDPTDRHFVAPRKSITARQNLSRYTIVVGFYLNSSAGQTAWIVDANDTAITYMQ